MTTCATCSHWFDLDADRKCPRLAKAHAQAAAYIASEPEKPKLFRGTGVADAACAAFVERVK